MIDFTLPQALEAHEPPSRRDGVRLLMSTSHAITHHHFTDLPALLTPGDLLVVNTSATLPAAVRLDRLTMHFSGPLPAGEGAPEPAATGSAPENNGPWNVQDAPHGSARDWIVELRRRTGKATEPYGGGEPREWFPMPGGATLTLVGRITGRLWHARLSTDVIPFLLRHGAPIRYGYVGRDWPLSAYQTIFSGALDSFGPDAERPLRGQGIAGRAVAAQDGGTTEHDGPRGRESAEPRTRPRPGRQDGPALIPSHPPFGGPQADAGRRAGSRIPPEAPDSISHPQPTTEPPSSSGGSSPGAWGELRDGSAEMPSASRPFTAGLVAALVSRGVLVAPLTLHTGVASPEAHEPPYAERFVVPEATADLVNHVRARGGRVIAVGTTVVRALETAYTNGAVRPARGWTEHVVTPEHGVHAVDGLLTGLHEPRSSHLMMLSAIAGPGLLERTYAEALAGGYRWHEFGDTNLLLAR